MKRAFEIYRNRVDQQYSIQQNSTYNHSIKCFKS